MYKIIGLMLLLSSSSLAFGANSDTNSDVLIIETTIVGGKQAPRFLSIVPWRLQKNMTLRAKPTGLKPKPLKALEQQEFEQTLRLLKQTNKP